MRAALVIVVCGSISDRLSVGSACGVSVAVARRRRLYRAAAWRLPQHFRDILIAILAEVVVGPADRPSIFETDGGAHMQYRVGHPDAQHARDKLVRARHPDRVSAMLLHDAVSLPERLVQWVAHRRFGDG